MYEGKVEGERKERRNGEKEVMKGRREKGGEWGKER